MIKTDCIHFPLDRPCVFHKKRAVKCSNCGKYAPIRKSPAKKKILIIKLNAMGDVLRTTFLLPGLKIKFPKSDITWITDAVSVPILENNPRVDRVLPFDKNIFKYLAANRFDHVINLDLSPESLSLAGLALSRNKIGFMLDNSRKILCSNTAAKHWLEMSAFDDVKKKNRKTYQYWMSKIAGLKRADYEIYTPLVRSSVLKAKTFARKHGLAGKTVIGINPGAGKRWKLKKWTDRGSIAVIKNLASRGFKVVLYGGCEEKELIASLIRRSGRKAISAGTGNSITDFFALLGLCDVVITGDTLALHAGLGLKKKVIGIFGPTSSAEIEMYKRGIKVVTPKNCACCYLQKCDKKPSCMDMIKPEAILKAVHALLEGRRKKEE
ncbi:MAG: glycosyltransferase family 9 protein [Elusimicrobiota bacterium]